MQTGGGTKNQFGLKRVALWTLYVAIFCWLFSFLPATAIAFRWTAGLASMFLILDIASPSRFRFTGWLAVSFFSFATACTLALAFGLYLYDPPLDAPKPPLSFLATLLHIVSGDFWGELGQVIGEAIRIMMLYVWSFVTATFISTTIAIINVRRGKSARCMLALNCPAVAFVLYCVVEHYCLY